MEGKRFGTLFFTKKLRNIYLGEEFRLFKIDDNGNRELKLGIIISDKLKLKKDDILPYFKLFENSKMKNLVVGEEVQIVKNRTVVVSPYMKEFRTLSEILEAAFNKGNGISLDNAVHILMSILDIALAFKQSYSSNMNNLYFLPIPDDIGFNSDGAVFYRYPICNFLLGRNAGIEEVISENFPYLFAPGKEISEKEEVYAFTSLFYFMLTGKRINEMSEDIDTAYIASSKLSVPYDLYKTIPEFVVPRIEKGFSGDYINLQDMQKDFEEIIMDGEITPSTFNLAFYINSLFREENKKELKEIEEEEKLEIPPDEIELQKEKEKEIEKEIFSTMEELEEKGGNKGIFVVIGIAAVIIITLVIFFMSREKKTVIVQNPQQQQINVEELAKKIEEKLSAKYEEKIKAIEEQYKQDIAKIKDEQKRKALLEERQRRIAALKQQQQQEKKQAVKQAIETIKKTKTTTEVSSKPESKGSTPNNLSTQTKQTVSPVNDQVPKQTKEIRENAPATKEQQTVEKPKVEQKLQEPTFKEGDIVPISTLDSKIKILKQVSPYLTYKDVKAGTVVRVIMQVLINEEGKVEKFRILRVFPVVANMHSKIKNVIYKWRFSKPLREGKKVKVWKTISLAIKK